PERKTWGETASEHVWRDCAGEPFLVGRGWKPSPQPADAPGWAGAMGAIASTAVSPAKAHAPRRDKHMGTLHQTTDCLGRTAPADSRWRRTAHTVLPCPGTRLNPVRLDRKSVAQGQR